MLLWPWIDLVHPPHTLHCRVRAVERRHHLHRPRPPLPLFSRVLPARSHLPFFLGCPILAQLVLSKGGVLDLSPGCHPSEAEDLLFAIAVM